MTSSAPNGNPLSRVISPAPGAAPALGIPAAPEGDAFPSTLTCLITQAPPERGIYFQIPDAFFTNNTVLNTTVMKALPCLLNMGYG